MSHCLISIVTTKNRVERCTPYRLMGELENWNEK